MNLYDGSRGFLKAKHLHKVKVLQKLIRVYGTAYECANGSKARGEVTGFIP